MFIVRSQKSKPYPITIDHVEDKKLFELWVLIYNFEEPFLVYPANKKFNKPLL